MSTDHVLKLYSKTIQSSFLHYGFWDDPENVDLPSLSLQDIKNAQLRYIEHLASFIPEDTRTILDVGCGIGGNTSFLLKKGYLLEALSPDSYQKSVIKQKFGEKVAFHHCKFENFKSKSFFDLILESESACYFDIDKVFKRFGRSCRAKLIPWKSRRTYPSSVRRVKPKRSVASKIKTLRKIEPYKGKGIREQGQYVLKKEGKKK